MKLATEADAKFVLYMKGYYLKLGHVWWIENDDEDNFAEYRIGPADSYIEAWKALEVRDWPRTAAWGDE